MSESPKGVPFFVGYLPVPKALRWPLALVAAGVLAFAVGAGIGAASIQKNPGDGRFAWDLGRQSLSGVVELEPYPVLRLPPDAEHPEGRALPLTAGGKNGMQERLAPYEGQAVTLSGVLLIHGDLTIMQVAGNGVEPVPEESDDPALAAAAAYRPPAPEKLGAITLQGEIVDSKCWAGAMRPGAGKGHMACANLCLAGGIPTGLVTWGPEGEETFFLLADPEGKSLREAVVDVTSLYVQLSGELERRGDLLLLKADPATLKVL